jgi:dienelactone hydrolase
MKYLCCIALSLLVTSGSALAALKSAPLEYRDDHGVCEGWLAFDDAQVGRRPGVLVIHDWMGVGPFVQGVAEKLAGLGYVVLCADIYGKGVRPKDASEASSKAGEWRADRALLRSRARAGLDALLARPEVDPQRVAAIGYCFGGGTALELARSGAPVAGTISFHGNLDTPNSADALNIKGKVLVLQGSDDPVAPPEKVVAFEDEMRKAGIDWQFYIYGGAVHAFTNPAAGYDPSKGSAYNERADRRSWAAMKLFFAEIFN